ncbi:hypothetical protein KFL_004650070 [Klebsormidium nitens]|uniref:Uncharacterized protein n=1 Tax=Klebsormidium nitens TaxID=105231 RepID=A0A1Y1IFP4_KLENI|nr:hypothetical protein KFL_004650070 [Klebsormidium nitens]|eukprot:GAQ88862.1 hypothetical protein KFL_004650070 [Klebsormidium nitens]
MGSDHARLGNGNSFELVTRQGEVLKEQSNALEREILRAGEGAYGAIATAFSTMVFMLRAIQSYAMHLRQHLSPLQKHDIQELMTIVQQEIHSSLLWLFQTVFSATPVLMVSVMLLLANFTVHSAGSLASPEVAVLDLLSASPIVKGLAHQEAASESGRTQAEATITRQLYQSPATESGGAGQFPLRKIAQKGKEGSPGQAVQLRRTAVIREEEATPTSSSTRQSANSQASTSPKQDPLYMQGLLEQAAKEMELEVPYHHVRLDQEVIRQLVAPLSVEVDPDNYPCFDRTELQYLNAIAKEPSNALLLGNMAMFMYVVRKDKERAHSYFKQALDADPEDGETLSRYASFLWLGLGNYERAEVAYKAAIASDPTNPYFTGSYAHFLWHARDDETSCPIGGVC